MNTIQHKFHNFYNSIFLYPKFQEFGQNSKIIKPLIIGGHENILIGKDVKMGYNIWLSAKTTKNRSKPRLSVGNDCRIGNFNHIYAIQSIIIEDNVLTADKVYISDNQHTYEDINLPIWKQPIKLVSPVVIKSGTWIGENVCVIGCIIGKNCVIGANSVVNKDIPDYSVAVGSPARIIKRFNFITNKWDRTNTEGVFLTSNL